MLLGGFPIISNVPDPAKSLPAGSKDGRGFVADHVEDVAGPPGRITSVPQIHGGGPLGAGPSPRKHSFPERRLLLGLAGLVLLLFLLSPLVRAWRRRSLAGRYL